MKFEGTVTVENGKVTVTGPFGEFWDLLDHPAGIGLAVCQAVAGQTLAPPSPWKGREEANDDCS
jgi:hypothetical protein